MAEADALKAVKDFVKNHPTKDKRIKDRLNKIIALGNKKQRITQPIPVSVKPQFLTPEDVEKGLDNFDVIDYTGRFTLIPAGYPLTQDVIILLKQLAKANPQALYVKQKTEMEKAGDIPHKIELD